MATTTQLALPTGTASPLALWHLLSFDAPTVAALWTWFIARTSHITLPLAVPVAMALAVWILYAADRLLDTRALNSHRRSPVEELEARHLFHHRHRRAFLIGIVLAAASLTTLLHSLAPAALRLYAIEGALLLAWFLILHATRSAHRLPKEIAVGLFFSAAVFIPTVSREPGLRPTLLPSAVLFAALCSLNCLFIYAWEHEGANRPTTQRRPQVSASRRTPHATTRFALARLHTLAAATAIACVALALLNPASPWPIPAACAIAAILLLILDRRRSKFSRTDLRAAADIALLTPILLLPFLR